MFEDKQMGIIHVNSIKVDDNFFSFYINSRFKTRHVTLDTYKIVNKCDTHKIGILESLRIEVKG
jgi:hypothetical protein